MRRCDSLAMRAFQSGSGPVVRPDSGAPRGPPPGAPEECCGSATSTKPMMAFGKAHLHWIMTLRSTKRFPIVPRKRVTPSGRSRLRMQRRRQSEGCGTTKRNVHGPLHRSIHALAAPPKDSVESILGGEHPDGLAGMTVARVHDRDAGVATATGGPSGARYHPAGR